MEVMQNNMVVAILGKFHVDLVILFSFEQIVLFCT